MGEATCAASRSGSTRPDPLVRTRRVTTLMPALLVLASAVAVPSPGGSAAAQASAPGTEPIRSAVQAARAGGVVAVCRHAITGSFREREPVDYADPSTQRRLSSEGERQAEAVGRALRTLGVEVGEAVASPMDRARRTAELMFGGRVLVDSAWHTNGGPYDGPARDRRLAVLAAPVERGVRFIVSHIGTMRSVLDPTGAIEEGDCVVVRPGGAGFEAIGVVPWRAWLEAAEGQRPGGRSELPALLARRRPDSGRGRGFGVRPGLLLHRSRSPCNGGRFR